MNLLNNQLKISATHNEEPLATNTTDASQAHQPEPQSSIMFRSYSLVEIEETENPVGDGREDWYRYVLARGTSQITGYHCGTLTEVTKYANNCAELINERNSYNRSKRPFIQSK
jgi:hypothetical protein